MENDDSAFAERPQRTVDSVFSWQRFRENDLTPERTRDAIIRRAFAEYIAGNEFDDDDLARYGERLFTLFRAGYLISELIADSGNVKDQA